MAGADARYTVTRAPTSFAPPDTDDFVTDAAAFFSDFSERGAALGRDPIRGQSKLDAKGELAIGSKLELPGQREPELVSVDAEVSDITRQALAGSTSAIVHPAEFYLGLKRASDYFVPTPGKLATTVVAIAPDGRKLAGKPLLVELSAGAGRWPAQDTGDGTLHAVSKPVDTVVGSCALTTAAAPQPCSIEVREGGYYVFHATAKDGRGNVAHAAASVYAIGEGRAAFGDSDKLTVELVPNKKQYKVGDRATVLVKSPFPTAEALVTVERAGVYRAERVTLRGATPVVSVPITDDLRPERLRRCAPDPAAHRPRAGSRTRRRRRADLSRRLRRAADRSRSAPAQGRPAAEPARAPPGATLTVDVQVSDRAGKGQPAEVTLYAVDEGVLSLIDYQVRRTR